MSQGCARTTWLTAFAFLDNNKNMDFDIRSLLVAVTLATAFCAAARVLLWRMHPTIAGLGRWALAGVSAVIAFTLILLYGVLGWPYALSLAQVCIVIGLVLSWDGFRRFLGKTALTPMTLAGCIGLTVVWVVIAQSQYVLEAKAVGNACIVATVSFLMARDLLRTPAGHTPAIRATGYIYAANAVFFLLRAVAAHNHTYIDAPLNPNGVAAVMLLWLLCSVIAVTLGMVLMTAERLQLDLDSQANHDPLTGALNRRSFKLLYDKAMAYSRRHQLPLSVLMIDLDNFKQVNDQRGHDFGDKVLCAFVAVAQTMLREDDTFCRFGGEEFVALLPNTSPEAALVVANRLRNAYQIDVVHLVVKPHHAPFASSVSIGIAALQPDESFENLLSRADHALYRAKDHGRNRCEIAAE